MESDHTVFTSPCSSKFLGEELAWKHLSTTWQLCELESESVSFSQSAEDWTVWINEQFEAKCKYHRHLAIGTDNPVIHQIENCLER
jgi:hypothetical protein